MRQWKLSPMDLESISRWEGYSRAKDEMMVHTDIPEAPWYVVESDIKRRARLNMMAHLLSTLPVLRGARPCAGAATPPHVEGIRAHPTGAQHLRPRPLRLPHGLMPRMTGPTGTHEASSLPVSDTEAHIELNEAYAAHNYHPLRVVLSAGEGAWVTDVEGRRYLDCLAGYSALNFGHSHPRLVARAQEQLGRLTLTSRGYYNDQLGPFARDLAQLTGKEMILPMNSGAEAVETAIKVARKWGYLVKGVPENQATIVAMEGNFHGRTTTIVSFSTDPVATAHYAPYTPASGWCRTATSLPSPPPSTSPRSPCCSNPSRARPA